MLHFLFNIQHYMMFEVSRAACRRARGAAEPEGPPRPRGRRARGAAAPEPRGAARRLRHRPGIVWLPRSRLTPTGRSQVIEPNWHVLKQKLRSSDSLDAILAHHTEVPPGARGPPDHGISRACTTC